jgi:hypothetical protein
MMINSVIVQNRNSTALNEETNIIKRQHKRWPPTDENKGINPQSKGNV